MATQVLTWERVADRVIELRELARRTGKPVVVGIQVPRPPRAIGASKIASMMLVVDEVIYIDNLTTMQHDLMQRALEMSLVHPAAVKPTFRGRRHGW